MDPWGCVVAECSSQVGVCVAEIDSDFLQQRRREMPVESHRRRDLYGHVSVDTAGESQAAGNGATNPTLFLSTAP